MRTFKLAILIALIIMPVLSAETTKASVKADLKLDVRSSISDLAYANGFNPSLRIINAISHAADTYQVDALELTAIAIVETGVGKYAKTRKNHNGTFDKGLFQINTVNTEFCIEYNLDSPEGSSLCAAKLLSDLKSKHLDYIGRYHSKTYSKKALYMRKITKVLLAANR